MKKVFLLLFCFVLSGSFCFAQNLASKNSSSNSAVQILMPKNVYVGDRCELKYVFHTDVDLFENKISGTDIKTLELLTDWPAFNKMSEKCLVYRVVLEHIGFEYTLTVFFIPWQTGVIDFSSFDLSNLVRASQKKERSVAAFPVDFAPVSVNSLAGKIGAVSLRPPAGPRVVPGTSFLLIILAVIFLVCAGIVIFFVLKLPYFLAFFILAGEQRKIKKLYKNSQRQLNKLLKEKKDDEEFCSQLTLTVRKYLCGRFDECFLSMTCGHFYEKFEEIACGSLSEAQGSAVSDIVEVFGRCDYIRFAKGSVDSFKKPVSLYEAVLADGEREILVNRCLSAIKFFTFELENEANDENASV